MAYTVSMPESARPVNADKLLTFRQAAERLSVSDRTVANLIKRGELRPVRIGRAVRFSSEELARFCRRAEGGAR